MYDDVNGKVFADLKQVPTDPVMALLKQHGFSEEDESYKVIGIKLFTDRKDHSSGNVLTILCKDKSSNRYIKKIITGENILEQFIGLFSRCNIVIPIQVDEISEKDFDMADTVD